MVHLLELVVEAELEMRRGPVMSPEGRGAALGCLTHVRLRLEAELEVLVADVASRAA